MAKPEPLRVVVGAQIDTTDLVAQLRGLAKTFTDAADKAEELNRRQLEVDPLAGTVTQVGEDQPNDSAR